MKALRVALIGAGRVGAKHARTLAHSPHATLSYVCDRSSERAAELAKLYGGEPVGCVPDVLTRKDVDAVVISSPSSTHARFVMEAARAGMGIYCEKPLDTDYARAENAFREVKAAGVTAVIGFARRFAPDIVSLRDDLHSRKLGAVQLVRIVSREPGYPTEEYLMSCGGIFLDKMIHFFDLHYWLTEASPQKVWAWGFSSRRLKSCELWTIDSAVAVLQFANRTLCTIEVSRGAPHGYDERIEVWCSDGVLTTTAEGAKSVSAGDSNELYPEMHQRSLESFLSSLSIGRPCEPSFDAALRAQSVAEAATEASISGAGVRPAVL